ncbi:galactose oxidase early set domain-containing protein [Streptomyces sp. NBC_00378]|uniref:galactose oxidase early set domain-containing protein n=1 Tax=Streptomyces sp. NBC_00378 TaxID=2975732 RepID=UPI002256B620|nr:galactose oxidase early set domain-containing protein [Streptomyces sp. NBC_00378]MCX5111771.1 galactose oxidase early set domain-containing protein [Streptomyces sp. NBC_00378]
MLGHFPDPDQGPAITSAKLIRPGAVTHVTDTDQRSVALRLKRTAGGITVTVPGNRALVPSGWHMLFVTDAKGTPSEGRWVEVPQGRAVRLLRRPRRAQRVLGPPCARLPGTAPGTPAGGAASGRRPGPGPKTRPASSSTAPATATAPVRTPRRPS